MPRALVKRSLDGIELSLDLFDRDRILEDGSPFLIAGEILPEQVEGFWNRYLSSLKEVSPQ